MYTNGPTLGEPGALTNDPNSSVGFNGINQNVAAAYSPSLNPPQFTLEAWANVTGKANTWRTVAGSRANITGTLGGYNIYAGIDNTWQFWLGTGGANWLVVTGGAVTPGWHHLAGTYDGTRARFYVDGALIHSTVATLRQNTVQRLTIGMNDGGTDYPFAGLIDDVAVYNVALQSTTVQQHFTLGKGVLAAPTVTTTAATAVTSTSATIGGTANPNGQGTSYYFQYGLTASYGSEAPIPSQSVGSGTSEQSVTQDLTGLSSITTYHYRVVATNPSGTSFGADVAVTTP
jgi:hypothetical protein